MSGAYLQDYTSYGYEISWKVMTWGKTGVSSDNLPHLFTLLHLQILINQYQTWPQYIMPIRSWMSSTMGQIEQEHPEVFALKFGKSAEYDFFYTLSSTNINQSAPNLVKLYVIQRS